MTKRKRQKIQWPKEKDRKYNDQKKKDKQWCTKHYKENYRSSNTKTNKNRGGSNEIL